ncbi:MAG: carboxypeptidase-like regulatory domain-containing protein [Planctomycetota bacterium]|jgi:hypothetical protein
MTAASRRGAIIAVVAMVAVVAGLAWFLAQDETAPQDVEVLSGDTGGQDEPTFHRPLEPGDPEPVMLEPEPDDGAVVVVRPPDDPRPLIDEGPVVARGSVSWPAGFGVESVEVILYDDEGFELDIVDTTAEGLYELRYDEPLPSGWAVGTEAQVVAWGTETTFLLPAMCSDLAVHVPGEPPVTCDLALGFAPTIAGRVTSRANGGPIEDAEVYAASTLRPWALAEISAYTDATGAYLLPLGDLPPQDVIVWFLADEYQAQLVGPMDLAPAGVPGEVVRVDASLDNASTLSGRVLDALNGLPIEGVMVTAGSSYTVFTRAGDWDVTNEDGAFSLETSDLPPFGSWLLAAEDGYGPAVVFPDSPAGEHEIHLGPVQTVDGYVYDSISGEPIEDADVMIAFVGDTWELDHGFYDEEFSDEDGHVVVELVSVPVGAARVRVLSDDHAPFDAPLEAVARPVSNDTWEMTVRLTSL